MTRYFLMSNYLGIATSTLLILKKDLKQKKQQSNAETAGRKTRQHAAVGNVVRGQGEGHRRLPLVVEPA